MGHATSTKTDSHQSCQQCKRQLKPVELQSRISICRICQQTIQPSSRPSSQSSDSKQIPSAYFQLLDSKIAELESAAGTSDQSASTGPSTSNANGTDRLRRPAVSPGQQQPRRIQNPLAIERFLNDANEPDAVREALRARMASSR